MWMVCALRSSSTECGLSSSTGTAGIEFDLVADESLKCDQCGGPLARGGLDEVWADDEEEEE
jgi:hypothetical protein